MIKLARFFVIKSENTILPEANTMINECTNDLRVPTNGHDPRRQVIIRNVAFSEFVQNSVKNATSQQPLYYLDDKN